MPERRDTCGRLSSEGTTTLRPRHGTPPSAVLDWLSGGDEIFDLAGLMFHGPAEWGTQPYWKNAE